MEQPKKKNSNYRGRVPTMITLEDGSVVNKSDDPAYFRNYFANHKDKIHRKVICECGLTSMYSNMTNHRKSARHARRLEENN